MAFLGRLLNLNLKAFENNLFVTQQNLFEIVSIRVLVGAQLGDSLLLLSNEGLKGRIICVSSCGDLVIRNANKSAGSLEGHTMPAHEYQMSPSQSVFGELVLKEFVTREHTAALF